MNEWTKEKPTETGWYWYRENESAEHEAAYVFRRVESYGKKDDPYYKEMTTVEVYRAFEDHKTYAKDMPGEWQGPIHPA